MIVTGKVETNKHIFYPQPIPVYGGGDYTINQFRRITKGTEQRCRTIREEGNLTGNGE